MTPTPPPSWHKETRIYVRAVESGRINGVETPSRSGSRNDSERTTARLGNEPVNGRGIQSVGSALDAGDLLIVHQRRNEARPEAQLENGRADIGGHDNDGNSHGGSGDVVWDRCNPCRVGSRVR